MLDAYESFRNEDATFRPRYYGYNEGPALDDNDPVWKQKVRYANDVAEEEGGTVSSDGKYTTTFQCIVSDLKPKPAEPAAAAAEAEVK